MKTLELMVDDNIYERLRSFLESLPKEVVQIIEGPQIPYVNTEEQMDIEKILKKAANQEIISSENFNDIL